MKKLFIFLFTIVLFFSCKDDEEIIFNADPADVQISFEPCIGGAFMNYTLPNDPNIYAIQAVYNDFKGKEIIIKGTYLSDKIELIGFNEPVEDIPVEISLIDRDDNISKTITKHFSTNASAAISVFDELEVNSYWDGFKIKYRGPEGAKGFINFAYVGKNPDTQEIDTLLVAYKPITKGQRTIVFNKIEDESVEDVSVVVWTEDFRNNDVKKVVFDKVHVARAERFDCKDVDFIGESDEDSKWNLSWTKLFDGDTKGIECLKSGHEYTHYFVSTKNCVKNDLYPERSVWTVDMKEQQSLAYVRIYSSAPLRTEYDAIRYNFPYFTPNHVKVYGTNDKDAPIEECDELGEFHELWSTPDQNKWCWPSMDKTIQYTIADIDKIEELDDVYMQVNFEVSEKTYRYVKIKVLETFYTVNAIGVIKDGKGQVYMEELEIYTAKTNK